MDHVKRIWQRTRALVRRGALEDALADLRQTVRGLRRHPGFTCTVGLTLALAIGANVAAFTVVHGVLLQWPYPHADRLLTIRTDTQITGRPATARAAVVLPAPVVWPSSVPAYLAWKQHATTLDALEGFRARLEGDENLELELIRATPGLLGLLGVRPAVGRLLHDDDARADAAPVLVLTFEAWMRRFGGDPGVVGQPVPLGEMVYHVAGVLEPVQRPLLASERRVRSFTDGMIVDRVLLPTGVEAIVPWIAETDPQSAAAAEILYVLARRHEDATLSQAQTEVEEIAAALREGMDLSGVARTTRVESIVEATVSSIRPTLLALTGAMALILLVAISNVANLLLARASARHADLSVRAALGSGRRRLVRLLLTESMLLALLGGIGGIAVGAAAIGVLRSMDAAWIPRLQAIAIDGTVIAMTLAVTLVIGLLLGLAPVFVLRRTLAGERHAAAWLAGRGGWLRSGLVVVQLALSLVLLAGSGLIIRSYVALSTVPIGVDYQQVTSFSLAGVLPPPCGPSGTPILPQCLELLDRLRALPGVHGATLSSHMPLRTGGGTVGPVEALTGARRGEAPVLELVNVTHDFFEFFRVRARAGRLFEPADPSREQVVVVDASVAGLLWPDEPAVGQYIRLRSTDLDRSTDLEVIGVIDPIRYGDPAHDVSPKIFRLLDQAGPLSGNSTFLFRRDRQAGPSLATIEALVADAGGSLRPEGLQPLAAIYDDYLREPRFYLLLLGSLGALGLVIAAIGVYGVVAYSVTRRTGEIGLRMVLGARAPEIVGLFCRQTARLAMLGVTAGLVGALWLTQYIDGLLFAIEPTDPVTLGSMAALLTMMALVATLIPMRRALRVDPASTLRSE